ncbi:MAG: hypothetical protein R2813_12005 [Flavobacteriales bacterium]
MQFKKLIFLAVLWAFSVFTFSSCNDEKPVNFNLAYAATISIPATNGLEVEMALDSDPVTTNIEQKTSDYNTTTALIESVVPSDIQVVLNSPSGSALDYFGPVEVYIVSDDEMDLIGSKPDISESAASSFSVTVKNVDVTKYVQKESFTTRLVFTPDAYSGIKQEVEVRLTLKLKATEA